MLTFEKWKYLLYDILNSSLPLTVYNINLINEFYLNIMASWENAFSKNTSILMKTSQPADNKTIYCNFLVTKTINPHLLSTGHFSWTSGRNMISSHLIISMHISLQMQFWLSNSDTQNVMWPEKTRHMLHREFFQK